MKNKKIFLLMSCVFFVSLFLIGAHVVLADPLPSPTPPSGPSTMAGDIKTQLDAAAGAGGANLGTPQDPRLTVAMIIRTALSLIGMVALVLVIYSGVLWMTAAGNEEQVTKAKTLLFQAVIGLIIIFMSYAIATYVVRIISGQWNMNPFGVEVLQPVYPPPLGGSGHDTQKSVW